MFVITSEKISIKNGEPFQALSETNGSVEFHNQLFGVDDCVVIERPNEELIANKE